VLPSGPLMDVRTFERLRAAQEKETEKNDDDPSANVKDTKPHDICAAYGAHRVDYISQRTPLLEMPAVSRRINS
jgi:hypothetical protein